MACVNKNAGRLAEDKYKRRLITDADNLATLLGAFTHLHEQLDGILQ
jgi:hypothetical protein